MNKTNLRLKNRLKELNITRDDLAEQLGRSKSYINQALNGYNGGFRVAECYVLLSLIGSSPEWFYYFFDLGR